MPAREKTAEALMSGMYTWSLGSLWEYHASGNNHL